MSKKKGKKFREKRRIDPKVVAKALGANEMVELSRKEIKATFSSSTPQREAVTILRLSAAEAERMEYECIFECWADNFDRCLGMTVDGKDVLHRAAAFTMDTGENGLPSIHVRFWEKTKKS